MPDYPPRTILELEATIHQAFPDLKWQTSRYIDSGWDHEVLLLDEQIIFRFPNDDEYTAMLANEIDVLNYVRPRVQLTVPKYEFIAPDKTFAGYRSVPGTQLTSHAYQQLSITEKEVVRQQLAGFLTAIHASDLNDPAFSKLPPSYMAQDQQDVKRDVAKYLPKMLTGEELDEVYTILDEIDGLIASQPYECFIHGDVYSSHLLWDQPAQQLGIIDFSDMVKGDPAIDFAELHEYGRAFVEDAYERYQGRKDDTFLQRAWIYQKWMAVYMLTDHFQYHKTSWEVVREGFDRIRNGNV